MYALPKDWELLTVDERVEWHAQRVEKEEAVFAEFEEAGVLSNFSVEELEARLAGIRKERKRVEALVKLKADVEFEQLWKQLQTEVDSAKSLIAKRAELLSKRMRRVGFRLSASEEEVLVAMKTDISVKLDGAETLEGRIIAICDKYSVCPGEFLIVDAVRDMR